MITIIKYRRGLVLDSNYVYIGRKFGPFKSDSKWHNPFIIGKHGTRDEVIEKYKLHILCRKDLVEALNELNDKILVCWCSPLKCHGNVLIDIFQELNVK